jgi:hypothetical protein
VQAVDVLRDERVQPSGAFQCRQRTMTGIRFRPPRRVIEALLPGQPADLRI